MDNKQELYEELLKKLYKLEVNACNMQARMTTLSLCEFNSGKACAYRHAAKLLKSVIRKMKKESVEDGR
jgi:hypothetical protein